jgi:hypothetical protein
MIHGDEAERQAMGREDLQKLLVAYTAYTQAMKEAGVHRAGDALQASTTGASVRVRDGKTQVLDGPYAEAKEQLAGYYLIEAPDLDAALAWAARCPGASYGAMEVRPLMDYQRA